MRQKKELNAQIGSRIRQAREAAGLTQERLGELVPMGPQNVSDVERGMVGVSLTALKRICQILGVSSDALLFGDTPENSATGLVRRLSRLTPEQFQVMERVVNAVMESFALPPQEPKD